ncbi:type II toxin-antitoxin system ChpB family toxin [Photorhabdus bodei]|uniref:Toxin ChpB n=1 Tax=Photorhabdus bodei TaxID=2029681 RepID=A0A329WZG4_9GAMM|nr:type II toxin-antitoxin system ChpB family toxin [Photorhabdus bodei]NDL00149.1 type II toxin-antitoxin system ChpB family toxin [Photorhabdus bodei]NDL04284.1 type II toxin-antitoxin system ChpB family toxin [Photorhabdus bodei]NDL08565.1 type II toxin-antitoxin system ChpB family toxin [Photorhabdus bodei]RAX10034.1 toxin ChpB [Photorhabdus bodei]
MVKRKSVFHRGDIVSLTLNPVVGGEVRGEARPALILSSKEFNELGMVLVSPITQGGNFSRHRGFTVTLSGTGSKTQGVVLLNQIRMVDIVGRDGKFIEKVDQVVVDEALAILQAIIE